MNKEFIPYEQAMGLKELGFNEDCFGWYNLREIRLDFIESRHVNPLPECCVAPIYQQAFRWFREVHGLCGVVTPNSYEILDKNDENYLWGCIEEVILPSYEEAEISCLVKLIEIVKQK